MSDDIGGNARLGDEAVKGQEVRILGLAKLSGKHRVDCENGGPAVGIDGMASVERGLLEVVLADESENAVVEVEAVAGQSRNGFGEFRGVRVLLGFRGLLLLLLLLVAVEGGERGLDAEAALATTSFGRSFFWGGEGEESKGDEGGWWGWVVAVGGFG